ncbi:helix-turn-helix domain-containing protein [Niabella insulamsoli]|uniref:helix-turn-helix domain-containing protein n=1 Tax=Niabella insulamsoli TaxID=3144874 RepID=UPI0031FE1FE1
MQSLFELLEHTSRSLFLTGRAGTGKTTFLKSFAERTKKNFAIVAPTGIAAINAGGVTMHSMFGLPLATFVPTTDFIDRNEAINIPNLLPHFKYRRDKLKLLRKLDMLIVDEVSMLRCDVLDMLDLALKSARRSALPFGGVQMFFIGDLFQLPPVVKSESEAMLYTYYASPFFFEAKALQASNLLTVSLTKVYRQTDPLFLQLLNAIRDNDPDQIDFELLHSRYDPYFESEDFCVNLVSHNYLADAINRQQLDALPGKRRQYKANVWGEFRPHLFPNEESLELKEGAQVMFVKNDPDERKRFYNGKLATVTALNDEEIKVLPQGEQKEITIVKEKWEHKKYFLNKENNIDEEVIGSFEQFPFKLAWAVTIHKSQGLTFDKVIIDAGKSFTSGQVYVALSRCRTLEGIVLKSRITTQSIIVDPRIMSFQKETEANDQIESIVASEQYNYAASKLLQILNIQLITTDAAAWKDAVEKSSVLKDEQIRSATETMLQQLAELEGVFNRFEIYIHQKLKSLASSSGSWAAIEEKSKSAARFFFNQIQKDVLAVIKDCYAESKGAKGLKGYNEVLKNFLETTSSYLAALSQASLLDSHLLEEEAVAVATEVEKKPSHIISYQLFEKGQTPQQIAAARNITESTVWGHLAKMAAVGVLDISRLFTDEQIKLFEDRFRKHQFTSIGEWKSALPDTFGFGPIRVLLNHFNYQRSKKS